MLLPINVNVRNEKVILAHPSCVWLVGRDRTGDSTQNAQVEATHAGISELWNPGESASDA